MNSKIAFSPQISLIVPCYNVASKCDVFFESLVKQTYTNIQLIIVNDGSNDETENKIFSYKNSLLEKGFKFDYIYQNNKGVGGAINTGLKRIKGDYFCWADPDDFYEVDAFKVRVDYLEKHSECSVLTCGGYDVKNGEKTLIKYPKHHFEKKQFDYLLNYESMFYSGCHIVKTDSFKKVNPNMDIYEARRGQTWQILLPIYYSFNRDCLDVPIYNYVFYNDSMSHSDSNYNDLIKRYEENETIQTETINRMLVQENEKEKIKIRIKKLHLSIKMYVAKEYKNLDDYYYYFDRLKRMHGLKIKDIIKNVLIRLKLYDKY